MSKSKHYAVSFDVKKNNNQHQFSYVVVASSKKEAVSKFMAIERLGYRYDGSHRFHVRAYALTADEAALYGGDGILREVW